MEAGLGKTGIRRGPRRSGRRRLRRRVAGLDAGTQSVKLVVYDALPNGMPGILLLETNTADLSTLGNKVLTASLTLYRGRTYWLGVRHSATASLSAWALQATPDINGGTAMVTTALAKGCSLPLCTLAAQVRAKS